jgi:hypothetical protein
MIPIQATTRAPWRFERPRGGAGNTDSSGAAGWPEIAC